MRYIFDKDEAKNKMNGEKNYTDQIKEYICKVCKSGKYNIEPNEFSVEVLPHCNKKRIGNLITTNVWELTFETKLTENDGNFSFSILSSVDPKYVAAYAVAGYIEEKDKYYEKLKEKEKREEIKPLFKRILY